MTKIKVDDVLRDSLARLQASLENGDADGVGCSSEAGLDFRNVQRIVADLGSDWAFVVRLEANGGWQREWIGGSPPDRPEFTLDDLDPDEWSSHIVEEDRQVCIDHFVRALENGTDRVEYRLDLPEIGVCWVESALRSIPEEDGSGTVRVYGTMRDISDRRATEEALRQSESQYRALVEQASDGILVFDESGRILASNHAAYDLFGLSRAELHTRRIGELFHPDDVERDPHALKELAAGTTLRSVRRLKRQGQIGWVWAELSGRRLDDGRVQATVRDITARMDAEQRIRDLAYFDSLTSLPNREFFREQIEAALERARRSDKLLALLFLDVDRFKQINDSLGHSIGDDLLVHIADRLRSAVRGSDSVARSARDVAMPTDPTSPISRLGGDEFTILIQDLEHAQDAARVARRVLHGLARPIMVGDREIFLGASIGIAVWPEDGENSEVLLRSADVAMYHAKDHGGNTYEFFNSSMNVASTRRLTIESGMRRALERDEFHLVYQPIRDARTGRVSAAEALIRWVDSEGEMIGPDEFIPIAEETGLIVDIGAWVLATACAQAVDWCARGFDPIRLSVNISVEQLRFLGISNYVDQVLFETGLSAADLELEITESSILDESPHIIAAVAQLTEMGIGFALDDFGTGYSSLSALQRFPIERLKIDRSFVAGVGDNKSDESLTSAILALAKRLDLKVVAEGVETEGQARFLADLGCDELQGYLFSRPLAAEAFESFLTREQKTEEATEVAGPEGAR